MLSLIVCEGSFHQKSRASGGTRPTTSMATPPVVVMPMPIARTTAVTTHITESVNLIAWSVMLDSIEPGPPARCSKQDGSADHQRRGSGRSHGGHDRMMRERVGVGGPGSVTEPRGLLRPVSAYLLLTSATRRADGRRRRRRR